MRLTAAEVNERHDGKLPADATLLPDDAEIPVETKRKKKQASGRFANLNAFVDAGMALLTGSESKVWLILFRDTKTNGIARTGQADIARRAGIKPRMVRNVLVGLKEKGFLGIVRRGRLNSGPSAYRVHPTGNTFGNQLPVA